MISGARSERLLTLGEQASMMRRDLDVIEARDSQGVRATGPRLARIEAPVAAGYNTFEVTFLDGSFTESAGNQTPTYSDRSPGFAHNIGDADMNVGDIVLAYPWSTQWWFRRGVSSQPPAPVTWGQTGFWEPSGSLFSSTIDSDPNAPGYGPSWGFEVLASLTSPGTYRRQSGFISFDGILFPQGTTITNAVLRTKFFSSTAFLFASAYPRWNTLVSPPGWQLLPQARYRARCEIYGHAIDDAPQYSSAAEMDAATRTTANTAYDHFLDIIAGPNINSQFDIDDPVPDIDVTSVVQEILNRPGWLPGNRMAFLFDETGTDQNTLPNSDICSHVGSLGSRDSAGGSNGFIELVITL